MTSIVARTVVPPPPGTTPSDIRAALELEAWLDREEDRQLDLTASSAALERDRATRPFRAVVALGIAALAVGLFVIELISIL